MRCMGEGGTAPHAEHGAGHDRSAGKVGKIKRENLEFSHTHAPMRCMGEDLMLRMGEGETVPRAKLWRRQDNTSCEALAKSF